MTKYLNGLSLQFYRGIGPVVQRMGPFGDFNFFIGANNSGKSTVLNFINQYLPTIDANKRTKQYPLSPLDEHRGAQSGQLAFEIAIPVSEFRENIYRKFPAILSDPTTAPICKHLTDQIAEAGLIWLRFSRDAKSKFEFSKVGDLRKFRAGLDAQHWYFIWCALTGQRDGSINEHWVPQTLEGFLDAQELTLPSIEIVPALRQVGPTGHVFEDFSGVGLIDRLAQIQSPDHDKRPERDIFEAINRFLQDVTGKHDARIEIPHLKNHILVHMDNKVLPLSSLGTGIHEVIMIASFCTLSRGSIICIEEPEIHLHPLLQKKLILFLINNTDNQYFVATHSASFIDTPGSAIFHVSNDGEQTHIRETTLRKDRFNICADLGYKASDLVQSNSAIWVEGPSDRIYLRHWLKSVNPDLVEGIHYSIMFYGGRLLSHLSADSEDLSEFIALRSLNQRLALVMDSDKRSAQTPINDTKKRLAAEFSEGDGICWITKGREIENYIPFELLQQAVKAAYSDVYAGPAGRGEQYEHALPFCRKKPRKRRKTSAPEEESLVDYSVDKVAIARLVCEQPAQLDVLDLHHRVMDLARMIEEANH
jgi:energy-coupling factor transporter ATP-binding protein EcfA2